MPFESIVSLSAVFQVLPDCRWSLTFLPSLFGLYLPITAHLALFEVCRPLPGPMMPGTIETDTPARCFASGSADVAGEAACTAAAALAAATTMLALTAIFLRMDSMRFPSLEAVGWFLSLVGIG